MYSTISIPVINDFRRVSATYLSDSDLGNSPMLPDPIDRLLTIGIPHFIDPTPLLEIDLE